MVSDLMYVRREATKFSLTQKKRKIIGQCHEIIYIFAKFFFYPENLFIWDIQLLSLHFHFHVHVGR